MNLRAVRGAGTGRLRSFSWSSSLIGHLNLFIVFLPDFCKSFYGGRAAGGGGGGGPSPASGPPPPPAPRVVLNPPPPPPSPRLFEHVEYGAAHPRHLFERPRGVAPFAVHLLKGGAPYHKRRVY